MLLDELGLYIFIRGLCCVAHCYHHKWLQKVMKGYSKLGQCFNDVITLNLS
jgi:hypothetical protein